jgi:hypothetical protein
VLILSACLLISIEFKKNNRLLHVDKQATAVDEDEEGRAAAK